MSMPGERKSSRSHAPLLPEAAFLFMSTNKVYGDAPNELPLNELPTRYDYADPNDYEGISESCRIDRCLTRFSAHQKLPPT